MTIKFKEINALHFIIYRFTNRNTFYLNLNLEKLTLKYVQKFRPHTCKRASKWWSTAESFSHTQGTPKTNTSATKQRVAGPTTTWAETGPAMKVWKMDPRSIAHPVTVILRIGLFYYFSINFHFKSSNHSRPWLNFTQFQTSDSEVITYSWKLLENGKCTFWVNISIAICIYE